MRIFFGILIIILGGWQMYATTKYFQNLKTAGNKSTSIFSLAAVYSSFFLAIIFIIIGLATVFHWF
ncbi:hypothetical protein [Companilactobacillus nuruki]|uniref:Immunity protein n=1 Tax=Companilactobacillus nuruki TaxID=1993540 RepID=A0A2N7AXG2_9LACO|nr:hypothetical protein [Companilactobacillus nuruki]PMD73781.1 hypothetical protein CBP76_00095 [Companilactobacillus nuruki]